MEANTHIHGTSAREQQRLIDQASRLDALMAANLELQPGEQGLSDIELVVGDATALPWPDGHFDRVRLAWVVEHLSEPRVALAEALRVLRPGGSIHLTETDYGSLRVSPPDSAIEALLRAFVAHFNRHGNAHAGPSLAPLLEDVGFSQVAVEMVGFHFWCTSRRALAALPRWLSAAMDPSALAPIRREARKRLPAKRTNHHHSSRAALGDLQIQHRHATFIPQPTGHLAGIVDFNQQHPAVTRVDPADHRLHISKSGLTLVVTSLHGTGASVEGGPVALSADPTIPSHLQLQTLAAEGHPCGHMGQSIGLPGARKRRQITANRTSRRLGRGLHQLNRQLQGSDHQQQPQGKGRHGSRLRDQRAEIVAAQWRADWSFRMAP
jgi:SAM-dependent methyltransferase